MSWEKDFRELILLELGRAHALMESVGDEIDPQFRIATPEGDVRIAMTLGEGDLERRRRFSLLADYMALRSSLGFVMSGELKEPDAVFAAGFSRQMAVGALRRVRRNPLRFESVEWMGREQFDVEMLNLVPGRSSALSAARLAELEQWFGSRGKYPAVRLARGGVDDEIPYWEPY